MTRNRDVADTQDNLGGAVAPFVAGKNKIINGDFYWNQRNLTTDSVGGYGFDRFICAFSGATATQSAQTFTLGTAPVAGYEAKNFLRLAVTTGNDFCRAVQTIENVRTFAGQTATLSFWAKGTNPSTLGYLTVALQQNFGTGGSPSATVTSAEQNLTLTSNWTRYSFTFNVPSIAGKTIGTNGNDKLDVMIGQISSTSTDAWTLDLWGVQFEAGSVATPFTTASGSIGGELALCQRYYYQTDILTDNTFSPAIVATTGVLGAYFTYPVPMRVAPTITTYDTAGASGVVTRGTYGSATVQNAQASTIFQTNRNGTNIYSGSGNSHTFIRFGYSASAEL